MSNKLINKYKEMIKDIEKNYKIVSDSHLQFKNNLKNYSKDEVLFFDVQSNTTTNVLESDFEYFERWYLQLFNQLKYRINKYDEFYEPYSDTNYNYKLAIKDIVYVLLNFVKSHENFMNEVIIDNNLFNKKEYLNNINKLNNNLEKLFKI